MPFVIAAGVGVGWGEEMRSGGEEWKTGVGLVMGRVSLGLEGGR